MAKLRISISIEDGEGKFDVAEELNLDGSCGADDVVIALQSVVGAAAPWVRFPFKIIPTFVRDTIDGDLVDATDNPDWGKMWDGANEYLNSLGTRKASQPETSR